MPNTTNGLPYPLNSSALDVPSDLAALATAADGLVTRTRVPTTKGDLVVRTASATTRLPAGTNNQYLQTNSAQTTGLQWTSTLAGQTIHHHQLAWVEVATAVASIQITGLGAYRSIEVVGEVCGTNTAANKTQFKANPDSGNSSYYAVQVDKDGAGAITMTNLGPATGGPDFGAISSGTVSTNRTLFRLWFSNLPNNTSKPFVWKCGGFGGSGATESAFARHGGAKGNNSNSGITSSLTFFYATGDIAVGSTIAVYGRI